MKPKLYIALIITLLVSSAAFSQRPPRPQGPPGGIGFPPGGGRPPMGGEMGRDRPDRQRQGDWIRPHDTNDNGMLEAAEFNAALDRTFTEFDRNGDGAIEPGEANVGPRPEGAPRPEKGSKKLLPPFFFEGPLRTEKALSKTEFEQAVRSIFNTMDTNHDGMLGKDEARKQPHPPGDGPGRGGQPGQPPNARFIAAELRFGDKLVKGQPFSAETIIEDTRRLFDGNTVTKQNHGAIYRSSEGRTRREQPLEMVGGIGVVGTDNKPQILVFINDFASKTQIFLDGNNKVARKSRIGGGPGPLEPGQPEGAKTESLGTKMIEGVSCEGTRVTFEIPAGQIGNEKPIQVISERWFSPELQILVMSRHLDPIAGEHTFKLVNLKRGEPSAELFSIPTGYRVEDGPKPRPKEDE